MMDHTTQATFSSIGCLWKAIRNTFKYLEFFSMFQRGTKLKDRVKSSPRVSQPIPNYWNTHHCTLMYWKYLTWYISLTASWTLAHNINSKCFKWTFVHMHLLPYIHKAICPNKLFCSLSHIYTLLHLQADMVYHQSIVCLLLSNPLMFYFCHALTLEIIACPSHIHTNTHTQLSTDIIEQCKQHSYVSRQHMGVICVTLSTSLLSRRTHQFVLRLFLWYSLCRFVKWMTHGTQI